MPLCHFRPHHVSQDASLALRPVAVHVPYAAAAVPIWQRTTPWRNAPAACLSFQLSAIGLAWPLLACSPVCSVARLAAHARAWRPAGWPVLVAAPLSTFPHLLVPLEPWLPMPQAACRTPSCATPCCCGAGGGGGVPHCSLAVGGRRPALGLGDEGYLHALTQLSAQVSILVVACDGSGV